MSNIPKHIAIVCDGNRRWAKAKNLPPFEGHRRAVQVVMDDLIEHAAKRGVKYLTFWIFSTENWQRSKDEVENLMNLFRWIFDKKIKNFQKKNIRFNMIGNIEDFAPDIQDRIKDGMEKTKDCDKIVVTLAMSYGGRDELTRAVKKIASEVENGAMKANEIDQELIGKHLDTASLPDPEFIIRTSGEHRLSGFLLWQCNYSELYFPKFDFPDFTPERFDEALEEFESRNRRFGK